MPFQFVGKNRKEIVRGSKITPHTIKDKRATLVPGTEFTEFTDKAISQNVRLLGCVKMCKNCDNCCCSTRLIAPTKTPMEREKRHNAVCNIAALHKTIKNNQASARTKRPH